MNVIKMVASSSFITVNVTIAHEVGLDASVILGELASSQTYWEDKGLLDEDGMFFETAEQIEEKTTLTTYKQSKAIKVLEDKGFIRTKMKGVPAKKYFFVDGEEIGRVLENKFSKNLKTRIEETSKLDSKKLETNKNKNNKNREVRKENNSIVFDSNLSEPVREKLIDFLEYRKEIKKPYKSERSIKALVTQVEKQEQRIGASAVIACIDKTIGNGWQGIYWKTDAKKDALGEKLDAIDRWGGIGSAESIIV